MKSILKCGILAALGAFLALAFNLTAFDSYASSEVTPSVTFSNGSGSGNVTDSDYKSVVALNAGDTVTIKSADGAPIEAIYLIWHSPVSQYQISTENDMLTGGEYGFLHEYIELSESSSSAILTMSAAQKLSKVRVFTSKNDIPDDVQIWQPPCEKADILVFSSHSDDEILFFGSAIAKAIYEKGAKVQLSYLTEYWTGDSIREHEKLDGLWCEGVRNYPVCGNFPDVYADSIESARNLYKRYDRLRSFRDPKIQAFNRYNT